jgi:hypothetical protein
MWFSLSVLIIAAAAISALFALKFKELEGKSDFLKKFSARGDIFLSACKRLLKNKSKEVHHSHVKPAIKKAGEVSREGVASAFEWCIRELRQAARLVRGKEPTASSDTSVSVFLKQMLDFKNGRNGGSTQTQDK